MPVGFYVLLLGWYIVLWVDMVVTLMCGFVFCTYIHGGLMICIITKGGVGGSSLGGGLGGI